MNKFPFNMSWNRVKKLFSRKKKYTSHTRVVPLDMRKEETIKSESHGNRKYTVNGETIYANNHAQALRRYKQRKEGK